MPHLFYLLTLSCVILALARPQYVSQWENEELSGKDIYFVVDLSNSMVEARGRLEEMRRFMDKFIEGHPENRMGIIVFGEEAFSYVPLTWDTKALQQMIMRLQPGIVPAEGTAMGNALYLALHRFEVAQAAAPGILLLSDGGNTTSIISPTSAARLAGQQKVPIHSMIWKPNPDSAQLVSNFSRDSLAYLEMGRLSGGNTQLIPHADVLEDYSVNFSTLDSESIGSLSFRLAEDKYDLFVWLALIFLLISFCIRASSWGNPLES
ncbi:MAG: VWA domain-containing protein [Bacteroidota bacterium]